MPSGPFCQSCSMPLHDGDYGTNADGSRSEDYCHYCFQNGKFTEPGLTMAQMIDKVTGFMVEKMKMSDRQARVITEAFIPKLKRWRGKA